MEKIYKSHEEEYGSPPSIIVKAPGLVNLLGGHTEYNDGYVLQAALKQSVYVAASPRDDNSLRFFAADYAERKRTTVPNLKFKREDRWANYIKGICNSYMQYGYELKGMNFTISSEVPACVGLATSAAIEIATAEVIRSFYKFDVSDTQFIQIANRVENDFMNLHHPLKSPLGCLFAKTGTAMYLDMRTLEMDYIPLNFDDYCFLITNSNLPLISPVEEVMHRREKCKECVTLLNQKKAGTALRDYTESDLKGGMGLVPEPMRRLCTHVVAENNKVLDGVKVLKKGDLESFGKIMNRSHESLRDNYEVSCPELDWLIKRAWETDGVLGARMNGPGFCGCTITLIRKDKIDNYASQIENYDHIFGFTPELYPLEPSGGVSIILP